MISLSKNILANLSSNIWLALLSFLLTPVYVWFLGVESYGLIGFYLSWVSILGVLDAGISSTASREMSWLAARPEEKGKIPSLLLSLEVVYWGIILLFGTVILVGAGLLGAEWFQTKDLDPVVIKQALMLMAVSLVVQVPSGLYVSGMMGLQRQVECSGLLGLFGTIRGFGAVLVLWLIKPDIRLFFIWHLVISALQTGVIRWFLWKVVSMEEHPAKFSLEILRSVKGFAGGMILITALSILITQADKMILSRMVSMEAFGYYMLAWTVVSGFSRISGPLTQAFYPRFTELVSKLDNDGLSTQFRLVSQLMNVLVLPPSAAIIFLSQPIIFVWTGDQSIAEGVSPILNIMVIGAVLAASSYPAACVLFSKKHLKPVITINLICIIVLLPSLILMVNYFGAMGGAIIWSLYGFILYISYQAWGGREMPKENFLLSILKDFVFPAVISFAFIGILSPLLNGVEGKIAFIIQLSLVLVVGWILALLVCKDLFKIVLEKLEWKMKTSH